MNSRKPHHKPAGSPMLVNRISADDFDATVKATDFIYLEFSKQEVLAGLIGTAVERLMLLSDSRENVEKFRGRVSFIFDGYSADPREIYDVPEIVKYLDAMTSAWPFWYHFLEKDAESVGILTLALSGARSVTQKGGLTSASVDPRRLQATMMRLFDGMNVLHEGMDLDESINMAITEEVVQAIERVMS